MTQKTTKPRRRLKDIDFSGEDSHIALVSKQQGGPANGADYQLVIKSTAQFSDEFVEKATKIKVEMPIEEFLNRFFHLMYDEAELLARALGFTTQMQDDANEASAMEEYDDWITSKVSAIEVIKALHEADSIPEALSKLTEDEYLALLKDQQTIEKAFKKIDRLQKQKNKPAAKQATTESDAVIAVKDTSDNIVHEVNKQEGNPSSVNTTKGKLMTQEVKTVEKEVEVVEKAAFDLVQKALDDQKIALEKAMQTIAQFEAEKKEQIVKSKTAKIEEVLKGSKDKEIVIKAGLLLDDADFDAFVAAVKTMQVTIEKSELFQEQGAAVSDEPVGKESAVAKILKAKQVKQKQ